MYGPNIICASPALNGNYACEVWIDSSQPMIMIDDKPIYANINNVRSIIIEPRLLCVSIELAG